MKTFIWKHFSCDCKYKFNSATYNLNQRRNNSKCQCECKKYCACRKHYSWNPSTCSCENSKYFKNFVDNSKTEYDEIINLMDSVS